MAAAGRAPAQVLPPHEPGRGAAVRDQRYASLNPAFPPLLCTLLPHHPPERIIDRSGKSPSILRGACSVAPLVADGGVL